MIISRKWLSQYMDVSDLSIEELADKITNSGSEVEGIEKMSQGTNLVIGKVLECVDHPDSDHLHVCKVDLGEKIEQIVCGAPNVAAGQKVIVARVGAKLPGGEIKAGMIRGQESNGMICSLLELGVDAHMLSEESKNGIEVLDEDAPVGNCDPLGYLGLDDEILDISLHIYIDPNYTKYRKRYEKWFKNDYVYQTLDKSAPEYVRNLWMTSAVLKNGARCDIFLDGYMVENFEKYISTINHQYFIDQIKIRKKLNLL